MTKDNRVGSIASEGLPYIFAVVVMAALIKWFFGWWSLPLWLTAIVLVYCFRRSERRIPASPLGVVSPADSRVQAIEDTVDPFLQRPSKRITLALNPLGEYTLRAPTEGKFVNQWHLRKGTVHTWGSKQEYTADEDALRNRGKRLDGLWIQTDEADDVVLELTVAPLRRPRCYGVVGQRVGQGQRCGFMPFGGRLAVYLPANARISVKPGDTVRSGSDLIASLVHG